MTRPMTPAPKPVKLEPKARRRLRPRTRIKTRNAKRKGSAFPKRRDYDYMKWVAEESPCLLKYRWRTDADEAHLCLGPVQVCHIKTRGAGGDDRRNVVSMCAGAHDEQHRIGIRSFQKRWDVDLQAEAESLDREYAGVERGGAP